MDQGMDDGNDVITIGDSYMNLGTTGIEQSLERISGRNYRNYAVAGTRVLDEAIPNQYDRAKAADANIKTVVMTAGGNDVIMGTQCGSTLNATCMTHIDNIQARIWKLHEEMAADGVQDVIYIGYGYTTGVWAYTKPASDYARMALIMDCTKDRMPRCHFIDPINELMGQIGIDGIHPTSTGYDRLGMMAWERMQAEGVRR
jgi:lysophospholipase L1-like esterase